MPHILRIHEQGGVGMKGWERLPGLLGSTAINSIPDAIHNTNITKVGSSIPTPFARMYLFETAFQFVADNNDFEFHDPNMYQHLVSDCLDMFQFIFERASEESFKVKKWDVANRVNGLLESSVLKHKHLGEAFELFFNTPKFKDTTEIFLFFYNNQLMGGTSPITGVYTSPNWKDTVKQHNFNFPTANGDKLFDELPCPIQKRDPSFIMYMYKWLYTNREIILQQSPAFYNYFINTKDRNNELKSLLQNNSIDSESSLGQEYKQVNAQIAGMQVALTTMGAGLHAHTTDVGVVPPQIRNSDFGMRPDVDHFKNTISHTPLVLATGAWDMKYMLEKWDSNTSVFSNDDISNRTLPNSPTKYPWVTVEDFLQDAIVELPFAMDDQNFITGNNSNLKYLLPIKKEYFKFFSSDSLAKNLTIEEINDNITVTLNIPIKGGNIPFRKIYNKQNNEEVIRPIIGEGIQVGVFPFYQVTDNTKLNRYTIMLLSRMEDSNPKLGFYKFGVDGATIVESNVRHEAKTEDVLRQFSTKYYNIKEDTFDLIEVEMDEFSKGLIIPQLKRISTQTQTLQYTFAIDFGTSNTHIAYDTNSPGQKIEPLTIGKTDRQMVLLSKQVDAENFEKSVEAGFGTLTEAIPFVNNEFIPTGMGAGFIHKFPIRTTTCNENSFAIEPANLFKNINIGFALESDARSVRIYEYYTNLKWSLTNHNGNHQKSRERVEIFFEQLLWLIKNKILLNNGRISDTTIITMAPLSMNTNQRNNIEEIWIEKISLIFKDLPIKRKFTSESIAPHFALIAAQAADTLNIDIGGGTTDVLFNYNNSNKATFSTSFQFAGSEIWGDGLLEDRKTLDNAFVNSIFKSPNLDDNLKSEIRTFADSHHLGSNDIISYFFAHDQTYGFTNNVRNDNFLRAILLLHYSAIIYHVCQICRDKNIPTPQIISFTGKGSKYIQMMLGSNEDDIAKLTKQLMLSFGCDKRELRIILKENPKEITAIGAIKELSSVGSINASDVENVVHLGTLNEAFSNFTIAEADSLMPSVRGSFNNFLTSMKNVGLTNYLNRDLEINFSINQDLNMLDILSKHSEDSFRETKARKISAANDTNQHIDETLFFWFLKDSLYQLTQHHPKK